MSDWESSETSEWDRGNKRTREKRKGRKILGPEKINKGPCRKRKNIHLYRPCREGYRFVIEKKTKVLWALFKKERKQIDKENLQPHQKDKAYYRKG